MLGEEHGGACSKNIVARCRTLMKLHYYDENEISERIGLTSYAQGKLMFPFESDLKYSAL